MNSRQTKAIARFTGRVENLTRYSMIERDDMHTDGAMIWKIANTYDDGALQLVGSNTESSRWYHRSLFISAIVGINGGIKVRADGIRGFTVKQLNRC